MVGKRLRKSWLCFLVVCIIFSFFPNGMTPTIVSAATTDDLEIRLQSGGRIGNLSYSAENTITSFYNNESGFKLDKRGSFNVDPIEGDVFIYRGDKATFTLRVKDNPLLVNLAKSGHATVEFGWSYLEWTEECETSVLGVCVDKDYQGTEASITVDGVQKFHKEKYHGDDDGGPVNGTATLHENMVITVEVEGIRDHVGSPSGVRGLYVKFKDTTRPVLNAYSFTGNGAERLNTNINQTELYVKKNEYIDLTYRFSEVIYPSAVLPGFSDFFLQHPLFVNPDGTGLPAEGQQQYLRNQTYTSANLKTLSKQISYRYTGVNFHNSGNLPLTPKISGTSGAISPIDLTMEEKLNNAKLADAAGNIAVVNMNHKADSNSNNHLRNKAVNPFDYENQGYRVIVDAVKPKYSKTGNGIQPEILTDVVLNDKDSIVFTVQFTEELVANRGWDIAKTYLLFNNGMKAYYQSGEGTNAWKFKVDLDDAEVLNTPLVKAIALTHDNKGTDTLVIQDYAGNMLIQPANYFGEHADRDTDDPTKFEVSLVNSKIDWAGLSIDNTLPIIDFRFEKGGASATEYKKNGKVTIDANDPNLMVPPLDPESPNTFRPSKGIYRPSNLSGSASPAVGLVYYYWSQSPDNPIASKDDDHYAAVKRFSLSGKQPNEDLYPDELSSFSLSVANNKTNLIAPPAAALVPENSGPWYLHTWTADMTWDSARELMQYEKMKTFVQNNQAQYDAWKAELAEDASEADRVFHADTKAMAAVGQYDDLTVWPLNDFKQDDSNWSYKVTPLLIDNRAPHVEAEVEGNYTSEATVRFEVIDEHSDVASAYYKFVKEGQALSSVSWTTAALTDGRQTVSTLDHADDDGVYTLYVRAIDRAGNESVTAIDPKVTIDSTSTVKVRFTPDSSASYTQGHDIQFYTSGLTPVDNQLYYTITSSSVRPTDLSKYKLLSGSAYNGSNIEELLGSNTENVLQFTIPQDNSKNGLAYVHITVKPQDETRIYTYTKAYYFDNEAPTVTFNRSGSSYPRDTQEVTANVVESYTLSGLVKKYQWVKEGEPAPAANSTAWVDLSGSGEVVLTNESLEEGETASFRLYVLATDGAGNTAIVASEPFQVSKKAIDAPPASGDAQLIYVYGNDAGQYTAVMKLNLDAIDKTGYSYSLSNDGGVSWSRWRPYTNFVSIDVPTKLPSEMKIQVKFQSPGKKAGEPFSMQAGELDSIEPVYALASLNTTKAVRSEVGTEIIISPALGVSVQPSASNPSKPTRIGSSNTFRVTENGYYSFELTDVTDPDRNETLFIVVSNIDNVPPIGEIDMLSSKPTNKNVSVKLNTSEPVRITNNGGKNIYTFTENGSFTFTFEDEAGNSATATAFVNFIDKQAPEVRIVRSYRYGEGTDDVFGTMVDTQGNVLASSGVVLTLEKSHANAKDFIVVEGGSSVVLRENGTVSFKVSDIYGNTTIVREEVTNIVPIIQNPELISYIFIDQLGNPVSNSKLVTIDGKTYGKGKLQLTFAGNGMAGNHIFNGSRAVLDDGGQYVNLISDSSGAYTFQRIAEANGTLAFTLSDSLGNKGKFAFAVEGLDNTAPELKLAQSVVAVAKNKSGFDFRVDLGGYTVSDNVSKPENITVSISGLELSTIGRYRVTYTAVDQVGNSATVIQDVYVVDSSGMQIFANGLLISEALGESALFDTNQLIFDIQGYNLMSVNGEQKVNESGTYDVLYYSGLYREGQMKYIATKLTHEQLTKQDFTVTFPKKGWYTIVVRNQERERVYATFFISKEQ